MRAGRKTSRMVGRRRNILNDNLIVTSGFASSHSHGLALTSDGTLTVTNYLGFSWISLAHTGAPSSLTNNSECCRCQNQDILCSHYYS